MKKYLLILIVFIVASGLAIGAQSLLDNPDYKKSLELKAMAAQAFEDGDYDAAAEYANQSKEYATLSDQYVEKMLAKFAANQAIKRAKEKMDWADGIDAMSLYPEQYGVAADEYAASLAAYDAEEYPDAADKARATVEAVNAIAAAAAEAAIAIAKDKIDWADGIDAGTLYPDLYAKATDAYAAAQGTYDSEDYARSAAWARSAAQAVDAIAVADADAAIALAKEKIEWADSIDAKTLYPDHYEVASNEYSKSQGSYDAEDYPQSAIWARWTVETVNAIEIADADAAIAQAKSALSAAEAIEAPTNYPGEYGEAKTALTDAVDAYDSQDYLTAARRARDSIAALVGVKPVEKAVAVLPPPPEWPAVYVVRLIPKRSDCLWRIAEYPFIYNNPLKWPVIYEANKKTFRDPSNPNLIFPGQKLKIPSIDGETRVGTFDPKADYEPFPKK